MDERYRETSLSRWVGLPFPTTAVCAGGPDGHTSPEPSVLPRSPSFPDTRSTKAWDRWRTSTFSRSRIGPYERSMYRSTRQRVVERTDTLSANTSWHVTTEQSIHAGGMMLSNMAGAHHQQEDFCLATELLHRGSLSVRERE